MRIDDELELQTVEVRQFCPELVPPEIIRKLEHSSQELVRSHKYAQTPCRQEGATFLILHLV